jgi:hypothetical protein
MPPQQAYGLLDFINQVLNLGTHSCGSFVSLTKFVSAHGFRVLERPLFAQSGAQCSNKKAYRHFSECLYADCV